MPTFIRVIDGTTTTVIREGDGKMWGDRECTSTSHDITGIEVVKEHAYRDLTVNFEVTPNETYYLLYAVYNTGDSFGWDDGAITFIDLFKTHEKAEAALHVIGQGHKNKSDRLNRYEAEDGKMIDIYRPWEGYFERLQYIKIDTVKIGAAMYDFR